MNRKLPYEDAFEQQMNRLQLPAEDDSWQKMKKLLDEETNQRPVSFFSLFKLKSWVVLLMLLLSGLEISMPFFSRVSKEHLPKAAQAVLLKQHKPAIDTASTISTVSPLLPHPITTATAKNNPDERLHHRDALNASHGLKSINKTLTGVKGGPVNSGIPMQSFKNNSVISSRNPHGIKKTALLNPKNTVTTIHTDAAGIAKKLPDQQNDLFMVDSTAVLHNDPLKQTPVQLPNDSAKVSVTENHEIPLKLSFPSGKKYFLSAGVGVQQQLPVGGQKQISYGYKGDKNILSDYIPSLYFRFEKDRQWFIQGEFSYAAPQLIKDFSYSRQTLTDSSSGNATVTSFHLKKTFNNQIPLSFNYYMYPNWSFGAGGLFSWFHGAITEKEIVKKDILPQAGNVINQIIPIKKYMDSFLYRSHTYVLLQTNYQWHNFSAGLRFKKDIQPFIKYTLPDGSITDRRNWSLEFMVRMALWKSAKF